MEAFVLSINPFWIWFALACLFLAIEVLIAPSGFFLCLGTAAAIVGLVTLVFSGLSWLWSLTLFALIAVAACWVWWQFVRKKIGQDADEKSASLNVKTRQLLGYRGILQEDMRAGRGRLKVNDSPWLIQAGEDYPAGTLVEVVDISGITLVVRKVPRAE